MLVQAAEDTVGMSQVETMVLRSQTWVEGMELGLPHLKEGLALKAESPAGHDLDRGGRLPA